MQFQADILQTPVERPTSIEATALGAAYLAGLAVGLWKMDDLAHPKNDLTKYAPTMSSDAAQAKYVGWQRAVEKSKDWESE